MDEGEIINAMVRINALHAWANRMLVEVGFPERERGEPSPLFDKTMQLYMLARIEGMTDGDARQVVTAIMTASHRALAADPATRDGLVPKAVGRG